LACDGRQRQRRRRCKIKASAADDRLPQKKMYNCAVWLDQLHANYTLRCLLFIQVIFTINNALPQLLRRNLFFRSEIFFETSGKKN
jgi:hypothetical protein